MKEEETENSEKSTITISKDSLWKYSTFVLGALVIVMAFLYFSGNKGAPSGAVVGGAQAQGAAPSRAGGLALVSANEDDDAVLGKDNAPITIIEFSDYQCPFCRKFWTETLPSIKKDYIDTGKVKLVYRDLPLTSLHPAAEPSAEAAECARFVGKSDEAYFKMHDKIFQEGNKLDGGDPIKGPVKGTAQFTASDLKKWAKDLGYNIDSCLDSGKFKDEVAKDMQDAAAAGGQGTPFFVIIGKDGKGEAVSGALPYASFKQILDAKLAG